MNPATFLSHVDTQTWDCVPLGKSHQEREITTKAKSLFLLPDLERIVRHMVFRPYIVNHTFDRILLNKKSYGHHRLYLQERELFLKRLNLKQRTILHDNFIVKSYEDFFDEYDRHIWSKQ